MRPSFSRFELRAVSVTVAVALVIATFSLGGALIAVSGPTHPELTVNICQPLQAACVTTITTLARPATMASDGFVLRDLGSIAVKVPVRLSADPSGPDTPPPKLIA